MDMNTLATHGLNGIEGVCLECWNQCKIPLMKQKEHPWFKGHKESPIKYNQALIKQHMEYFVNAHQKSVADKPNAGDQSPPPALQKPTRRGQCKYAAPSQGSASPCRRQVSAVNQSQGQQALSGHHRDATHHASMVQQELRLKIQEEFLGKEEYVSTVWGIVKLEGTYSVSQKHQEFIRMYCEALGVNRDVNIDDPDISIGTMDSLLMIKPKNPSKVKTLQQKLMQELQVQRLKNGKSQILNLI